jgi:GNAT superfamily N-acetyltransferase
MGPRCMCGLRRSLTSGRCASSSPCCRSDHGGFASSARASTSMRPPAAPRRARPGRAEVAFAVADAWHGHGIATVLLAHLAHAASAAGIGAFEATVLSENRHMLGVFHDSGFPVASRPRVRGREGNPLGRRRGRGRPRRDHLRAGARGGPGLLRLLRRVAALHRRQARRADRRALTHTPRTISASTTALLCSRSRAA